MLSLICEAVVRLTIMLVVVQQLLLKLFVKVEVAAHAEILELAGFRYDKTMIER
jgi:hypothetical protein